MILKTSIPARDEGIPAELAFEARSEGRPSSNGVPPAGGPNDPGDRVLRGQSRMAPTATLLPAGSSTVTCMALQTGTGLYATRGELPTDVAAAVGTFGRLAAEQRTPTQAPSDPGLVRRLREAGADVPTE